MLRAQYSQVDGCKINIYQFIKPKHYLITEIQLPIYIHIPHMQNKHELKSMNCFHENQRNHTVEKTDYFKFTARKKYIILLFSTQNPLMYDSVIYRMLN